MTTARTQWIKDRPAKDLRCRRLGHAWTEVDRFTVGGSKLVGIIFLCDSCNTDRTDVVDKKGTLEFRFYDYDTDYIAPSDLGGRVTRSEFVAESIRRHPPAHPAPPTSATRITASQQRRKARR